MDTNDSALSLAQLAIKHAIQSRLMNEILPHAQFYILALPILLLLVGGLVTMILGDKTTHKQQQNREG